LYHSEIKPRAAPAATSDARRPASRLRRNGEHDVFDFKFVKTCSVLNRGFGVVMRDEHPGDSSVARLDSKMQSCIAILTSHDKKEWKTK
jgi:hypothetical protein